VRGGKGTHILLVEGDDVIARERESELRSCGFEVFRVSSGEEAATVVEKGEFPVAVALIDAALGNLLARSPVNARVFRCEEFPVVALLSVGSEGIVGPEFACYGCVGVGSGAEALGTSLKSALRLFFEHGKERRLRSEFEKAASQAKFGLFEVDEQSSQFFGSVAACEILGLTDAGGATLGVVSELYVSEPPGTLQRAIERALSEERPFNLISEIQTRSGSRKWVRTQGQSLSLSRPGIDSRKVFGTIQDISEIRLLDRVTQESEMTLNQVEQITHIGHWSVGLQDGSFYHSDEIKRIFGYEPSEYALSVEDAINAYHPDDRDELLRLFNRAIETGEGYEFDLRVVQPTGEIRYVHSKGYTEREESGKIARVYGVFLDITDQVLAERALREGEASLKALVDGVHTAIVVHGKDGEILLSNQMANRLLAPFSRDVVGKDLKDPVWRFVYEDGREVSVEELPVSRVLRTEQPVENLVIGWHTRDESAWLLVNGVPVFDNKGVLSKVIISFVDISVHKEMEERLHQAEKMKATGQLAGGVAHDFNNQLMMMMGFAELLQESLAENSPEHLWAQEILSGVNRSSELTKQLLAFARKGKYVVTTVELNALVAEVCSIAAHSFDKKIRISQRSSDGPATIAGDVSQLQNAILNMALNSRDAMPEGGELVFTTERVMLDELSLKLLGLDPEIGECVRVTIRDTGVGMDAATQRHIFEPFFTTKGLGKGTGMGMASVYGTVENHHGAIQVESEPGSGTTITMTFPFTVALGESSEEPRMEVPTMGGRILLIDDDHGVADSMSTMLRRKGYETTVCLSGREGVLEYERTWTDVSLVLLDMIMPEMSGLETLRALKSLNPDVRVVLISGYSFSEAMEEMKDVGAAGFLVKPITSKDLLRTISEVILRGHGRVSSSMPLRKVN
jgi:PAS domain S-box-containing protein